MEQSQRRLLRGLADHEKTRKENLPDVYENKESQKEKLREHVGKYYSRRFEFAVAMKAKQLLLSQG
jgi:phosphoribosyl-AMP cyclohydrolase